MNNKWALRTQLNEIGWLAVLFAVVGATVALRYMTGLLGTQWWQYLYVFGAAAGVFFIGHFLLQLWLVLPLSRLSSCGGRGMAFGLTFILLVSLVTDTFVYQQYRFHINWAMIDLAFVGGRDVFSFSTGMILKIAFLVGCLARLSFIVVWSTTRLKIKAIWPCVCILVGYLAVNAVSAYSVSQNVKPVTVLAERIPLYYPIRANTLLSKFGLVAVTPPLGKKSLRLTTGDEVLLIKMSGALEGHNLKDWKEIDAAPLKKWVPTYLQMRGEYRQ